MKGLQITFTVCIIIRRFQEYFNNCMKKNTLSVSVICGKISDGVIFEILAEMFKYGCIL